MKKKTCLFPGATGGGNVVDVLRVACVCVGCWILLSECEMICFGVETHTSVPSIFSNL